MKFSLHIALRYLFAKKTHNVINIISIISAIGIAIGSMALIVILSVYNGFDNSIRTIYESYKADFVISPIKGKTINIPEELFTKIKETKGVENITPILEDNVFIKYSNSQAIALIRGIDTNYATLSNTKSNLREGDFNTYKGEIPQAIVGEELAQKLNLRVRFLTPIEIFFPDKNAPISPLNPMGSLNTITLFPSGIIRLSKDIGMNILYAPIKEVKDLLGQKPNEYSSIEVFITPTANENSVKTKLSNLLPENATIKNRLEQNATAYKIMQSEKFAVYMILFFIILIISINLFSSLSMLLIDKSSDIQSFKSLGATDKIIRRIFHFHGFFISLIGCIIGLAIGLTLCFIQQHYNIIEIPGNYLVSSYPIKIELTDILITIFGVSLIGYIIAYLPVRKL